MRIENDKLELLNLEDFSQLYHEKSICVRQARLTHKNQSPLWRAAAEGNEAVVKLLLEKGADLEARDSLGCRTPLWWAARNKHEAVVKLLLEKGADLEARGSLDQTPLWYAAGGGGTGRW